MAAKGSLEHFAERWRARKAEGWSVSKFVKEYNKTYGKNYTADQLEKALNTKTTSTTTSSKAAKTASDDQIIARLKKDPILSTLLKPFFDIPELRKLLIARAPKAWGGGGWSQEKFEAALLGTKYYQKHNQNQIEWITLSPAEQKARIREYVSEIYTYLEETAGRDWLIKNGYNDMYTQALKGMRNKIYEWAEQVASGRISEIELKTKLHNGLIKDPTTDAAALDLQHREEMARLKKRPEEIAEELWQQAHGDYFINITKDQARVWANNIINGVSSYGEFNDFLRRESATLYSAYAESINNGVLPRLLFGPALGVLSNELEMSEEQIIADQSLWGEITRQASVKDGQFSASDWVQYARALPQWKSTRGANEMVANFADRLLRQFGAIA